MVAKKERRHEGKREGRWLNTNFYAAQAKEKKKRGSYRWLMSVISKRAKKRKGKIMVFHFSTPAEEREKGGKGERGGGGRGGKL